MRRSIGKVLLIGFLLWHMFAVAVYSTPRDSKSDFATLAKSHLIPFVSPYVWMTSQWQLWDIFSPDPVRRVTHYRFDVRDGNDWRELVTLHSGSYSFFNRAINIKMTGNLFSEFQDNRGPFAGRFMQLLCGEYDVASGTSIRLVYIVYVLPYLTEPQTAQWWAAWQPETTERIGFTSTCP